MAEKHYLRVLRSDPFLGAGIGPLIKHLTKAAAADTTGKKSKVLVALLKKGSMRAQRAKVQDAALVSHRCCRTITFWDDPLPGCLSVPHTHTTTTPPARPPTRRACC